MTAKADEGMWLPSLISQRIADMQEKGFKLNADDIYNIKVYNEENISLGSFGSNSFHKLFYSKSR